MSLHVSPAHLALARTLVDETEARGGLAPVDLDRFWTDQEQAARDPWSPSAPQVPIGIFMSNECVWAELGVPEDWHRLHHDAAFRVGLERRYNDVAERIVGRRLLGERMPDPAGPGPMPRSIEDLFEGVQRWEGWSYWLQPVANTPDALAALLDRVDQRLLDLRSFLLPPQWEDRKRDAQRRGAAMPRFRGMRGPVTFAMSLYGVENTIYLLLDEPALAARFRDTILRAIVGIADLLNAEAAACGAPPISGFYWRDDNCAMLNADLYESFGYPILEEVFRRYSPNPGDLRGQHSDSEMGHLLPLFGRLGMNNVNFGPTLTVAEIRHHLPRATIYGQLAPFTLMRNESVNLVAEFLRDYEMAREHRGLVFATAGSINNGSRLASLRLLLAAVQRYGRYG